MSSCSFNESGFELIKQEIFYNKSKIEFKTCKRNVKTVNCECVKLLLHN